MADSRAAAMLPPDSVGRLAVASVAKGFAEEPLAEVRRRLSGARHEVLDLVVVLDADGRYAGAADLRDVMAGPADALLGTLIRAGWPHVSPETDQEHAAEAAIAAGVAALAVVDGDGKPLGCLPATALVAVLAREHREDLHRLAGILREGANARHALEDPPLWRVSRRLPWLLVGLVLSAGAAMVMASYESALNANLTIAFFIPSLVYLTDAIGTQTEAIAVRGLAVRQSPLSRLLLNELATGAMIGLALGLLAFVAVWVWFGDPKLAGGVGLSLLVAGALASTIGLLLPWSFARIGIDPAFGSGPLATIIQDVLTILLYFMVMTTLLA